MRYYKLINEDCVHHGLKYQPNTTITDSIPFCADGECQAGGIYFFSETQLFEKDFTKYVDLRKVKYICEVTIPEDAKVYHETGKSKASSLTFGEFKDAWKDERFCMSAVRQNGNVIEYVEKKTPEICLAAVRQNGSALQYVKEELQTPDICLAAVKNKGWALKYVEKQTPEICLAAVRHNAFALRYVDIQTPEICLAAIQHEWSAYLFVDNNLQKIPEVFLAAKQENPNIDILAQF